MSKTNSVTGTTSLAVKRAKSSIGIKGLAKDLKICKANNVNHLEFYENGAIKSISMGLTENLLMTPSSQARGSAKKAKAITDESKLQMQLDEADDRMSQLQVEDPVLFEQMLINGEFSEREKDRGPE